MSAAMRRLELRLPERPTGPRQSHHDRVIPLRRRPGRRWQRPAACAHPHACTQVVLTAAATQRVAAKVIIHDGAAWMEPTALAANPAGEIYVL
jgi:hypothetical protein